MNSHPMPSDGSAGRIPALPPVGFHHPEVQDRRVAAVLKLIDAWLGDVTNLEDDTGDSLWEELTTRMILEASKVAVGFNDTRRNYVLFKLHGATGIPVEDLEEVFKPAVRIQAQQGSAKFLPLDKNEIDTLDMMRTALAFLGAGTHWVRLQGSFYRWRTNRYEQVDDETVIAAIYEWLVGKQDFEGKRINADRALVEKIFHALCATALLDSRTTPAWLLKDENCPDRSNCIPFSNGMLDMKTRELHPHTHVLFNSSVLDFPYDSKAPEPCEFKKFLGQLWPNDQESVETLQEWFGLSLTADTSFQKILLLLGPPRSGKGTIFRIWRKVAGENNTVGPTLAGLSQQFGMQTLIGKRLALIPDARLGGRTDVSVVAERLLSSSGEDTQSIPRKHQTDYTARLETRFVIGTNEIPALLDQSGALASRFIVLKLDHSFLGKEDLGLEARLSAELPSILQWALEGLDRLRARGHFLQPASGGEALKQLETMASPTKAFVADRCIVAPGKRVECSRLYQEWESWAADSGRDHTGTIQIFGRNLLAAFPHIKQTQPRICGRQVRHYEGIALADTQ